MKNRIVQGSIAGLIAAFAAVILHSAGLLQWLENPLWNMRVRMLKQPSPHTPEIKLILIDQPSLNWGREVNAWPWPWPRTVHAAVASFCRRGGAKSTVFDLTFTENSRQGADDDQALGEESARSPNLVLACFASNSKGMYSRWPDFINIPEYQVSGLDRITELQARSSAWTSSADFPVPEIASNACHFGNVFTVAEKDDVIRRIEPFFVFENKFLPSLGLASYLAANPSAPIDITPSAVSVGNTRIPLDDSKRSILNFRGPRTVFPSVSAQAVIQSEIQITNGEQPLLDPSFFKDSYVFYGSSATALFDIKATPVSSFFPGVAVHATFLDNLLTNDFIKDASLPHIITSALLIALLTGILTRLCSGGLQLVAAYLLLLPVSIMPSLVSYKLNIWAPAAASLSACLFSLVSVTIINYALEGRQKKFIKQAFRQYLSPVVIEQLLQKPDSLTLGGETRELTIFFSDVQGFTTISEALSPQDLTALLNDYLSAMTDIILDEGGTVDKYEGDAIIAFWNAPVSQADHPVRAVRAALRGQRKLAELRPAFRERINRDIFARAGLNTGKVVVGNMGSSKRFDYTFLGDAGNLASRLEGINKQFGTYLMISEFTKNRIDHEFKAREISKVRVVGKAIPVTVYEPLFPEDFEAGREVFNVFDQGLRLFYEGRFSDAAGIFSTIAEADPPARAYAGKCRQLLTNPPAQWDGVWQMTEK